MPRSAAFSTMWFLIAALKCAVADLSVFTPGGYVRHCPGWPFSDWKGSGRLRSLPCLQSSALHPQIDAKSIHVFCLQVSGFCYVLLPCWST